MGVVAAFWIFLAIAQQITKFNSTHTHTHTHMSLFGSNFRSLPFIGFYHTKQFAELTAFVFVFVKQVAASRSHSQSNSHCPHLHPEHLPPPTPQNSQLAFPGIYKQRSTIIFKPIRFSLQMYFLPFKEILGLVENFIYLFHDQSVSQSIKKKKLPKSISISLSKFLKSFLV